MSEPTFITELRASLERAGATADPSALSVEVERVREHQEKMQAVINRVTTVSHDDGTLTLEMDGGQHLRGVALEGAMAQRPSAPAIETAFRETWVKAQRASAAALREDFKSEFGIDIPDHGDRTAEVVSHTNADVRSKLAPLLKNEVLGSVVQAMLDRAEQFQKQTFTGEHGVARVSVDFASALTEVALDVMAVRETDNVTIAEDLLRATQTAQEARDAGQTGLGTAELPDELRPERQFAEAQDLIAGVRSRLAQGL